MIMNKEERIKYFTSRFKSRDGDFLMENMELSTPRAPMVWNSTYRIRSI